MKFSIAVLTALTALVLAATASAADKVEGIKASLKHGTLSVKGGGGGQQVAVRLKAGDAQTIQVDAGDNGSADFSFDRGKVHAIDVKMGDGNDSARIDDGNGAFTNSIATTLSGGDGNDMLEGGQVQVAAENEKYKGGDGNDLIDGGKGNDTANLGAGDDTFRWDNGEGSDVIEGRDGTDTMVFNGAGINETISLSASPDGGRLTFFRAQGNVTMDTNDVEIVDDNPVGGTDSITVNDLTGTDVTRTNVDLGADAVADSVAVNATDGVDSIAVNGNGSGADLTGLATAVSVKHADPTLDTLTLDTRAGTDNVAVNGVVGLIQLAVI